MCPNQKPTLTASYACAQHVSFEELDCPSATHGNRLLLMTNYVADNPQCGHSACQAYINDIPSIFPSSLTAGAQSTSAKSVGYVYRGEPTEDLVAHRSGIAWECVAFSDRLDLTLMKACEGKKAPPFLQWSTMTQILALAAK